MICYRANETKCAIEGRRFCFTGGVACDGIENCGLAACYVFVIYVIPKLFIIVRRNV